MEFVIQSKAEYDAALETIHEMMSRGEDNLSEAERSSFFRIAVAIERFEDYFQDKNFYSP
jgi:hypothetical protein